MKLPGIIAYLVVVLCLLTVLALAKPGETPFLGLPFTGHEGTDKALTKLDSYLVFLDRALGVSTSTGKPTFPLGVAASSKGLQAKRAAGCTTAAAAGTTCTTVLTWDTAFADTSYTAACFCTGTNTILPMLLTATKAASTITVTTVNMYTGVQASACETIDCIALHD